jgi:hypothetical protein
MNKDFKIGSFYTGLPHSEIKGALIVTYYDPQPYQYGVGSKHYPAIENHPGYVLTKIIETRDSRGQFIDGALKVNSHHTAVLELITNS